MEASAPGARKARTPQVPYTLPAARRSVIPFKEATSLPAHDAQGAAVRKDQVVREMRSPAAALAAAAKSAAEPPPAKGEPSNVDNAEIAGVERPHGRNAAGSNSAGPSTVAGAAGVRRRQRQAWAQYVPPGRRGAASGSDIARSPVPTESTRSKRTACAAGGGSGFADGSSLSSSKGATTRRSMAVDVGEHASTSTSTITTTTTTTTTTTSLSVCDGEEAIATASACDESSSIQSALPSPAQPPPSPPCAVAIESTKTAMGRRDIGTNPPPVAQEEQADEEDASRSPRAIAAADAVETPCKESTTNATISESSNGSVDKNRFEEQELPPLKLPSARYVPPGRRKFLDAEAAAAAAKGTAEAVGIGPLWTSRAPVRVRQREHAPSMDTSAPARPIPARVARVVSGGMSAYGANISEYSEEMSREEVEACTAVISNFPSALPPGQRESILQPFVDVGGLVVWPRPDEALVTFASPALARQAVSARNNRSTVLIAELLSQTSGEKRMGYRRVELVRPGRPPADVSSGSRLIFGALGIRKPKLKIADAEQTRKSPNSKGGIRGRGAKHAQAPPAESTDSWDL